MTDSYSELEAALEALEAGWEPGQPVHIPLDGVTVVAYAEDFESLKDILTALQPVPDVQVDWYSSMYETLVEIDKILGQYAINPYYRDQTLKFMQERMFWFDGAVSVHERLMKEDAEYAAEYEAAQEFMKGNRPMPDIQSVLDR